MMHERFDANQASWDERTTLHLDSLFYDVEGWLRDQPGPRAREIELLGPVDHVSLVHLQCHFGLDTLAFARAGATVTGLDFSSTAIAAARDLAKRAGLDATFVCANVEDAVTALEHRTFDIVYVSLGALTWLPSVVRWAGAAAGLVAPGGRLYVHDVHPLAWSMADDGRSIAHSYFEETQPYVSDDPTTYTDQTRPLEHRRTYEWNHSLSEIVNALLGEGLRIRHLDEHDWTVWQQWPSLVPLPPTPDAGRRGKRWSTPPGMPRLPLTFSLLADRVLPPESA
jgi:SAM-dependent methyltransferase